MPTEIISGLWFGDIDSLKNPNFFTDNDINIIINLTDCNYKIDKKVSYINVPLSSYNIYSMKNVIDKIIENIHNNIELNNIYVYCINGIKISQLVCSLFLLKLLIISFIFKGKLLQNSLISFINGSNISFLESYNSLCQPPLFDFLTDFSFSFIPNIQLVKSSLKVTLVSLLINSHICVCHIGVGHIKSCLIIFLLGLGLGIIVCLYIK